MLKSNIKALCLPVSEKKFSSFVPMFEHVTPEAGPVLTPGASFERLPVSEKKNFKVSFFVHMFKLVTPRAMASFDQRGII